MPDCIEPNLKRVHVATAVARHGFIDPADWALGVDELADLSDEEIERLDELTPYDADRLTVFERANYLLDRLRGMPWRQALARALLTTSSIG